MLTGTVKSFNHKKCYGFIVPSTGGKEIFVHATRLREEIHEGDEVQYDVRETAKGPEAVNVVVVRH